MKRKLSLLITIVMVLTCVVPMGLVLADSYGYTMEAGTVDASGIFTLDISVAGGEILGGFFTLDYDETKVELLAADGITPLAGAASGFLDTAAARNAFKASADLTMIGYGIDVPMGRMITSYYCLPALDTTGGVVVMQPKFKLKAGVTTADFDSNTFTFIKDIAYITTLPGALDVYAQINDGSDNKLKVDETNDDLVVAWDYPNADKPADTKPGSPYYRVENTTPNASGVFQVTVKLGGGKFFGGFYSLQYDKSKVELVNSAGTPYTNPVNAVEAINAESIITLIGSDADVTKGYVFSSYYSADFTALDASATELLLFSPYFKLKSGVTTSDFDEDTFTYANDYLAEIEETNKIDQSAKLNDEDGNYWYEGGPDNLITEWDYEGGKGTITPTSAPPATTPPAVTTPPVTSPSETPYPPQTPVPTPSTYLYYEPFDGYTDGQVVTTLGNPGATWTAGGAPDGPDNYSRVENGVNGTTRNALHTYSKQPSGRKTSKATFSPTITPTAENSKVVVEFEYMVNSIGSGNGIPCIESSTGSILQFQTIERDGQWAIRYLDGGQQQMPGGEYYLTPGEFHHFKVIIDLVTKTYDCYVYNIDDPSQNSALIALPFTNPAASGNISAIGNVDDNAKETDNDYYFDEFKVYRYDEAYNAMIAEAYYADGTTKLNDLSTDVALNSSFILEFSSSVNPDTIGGIALKRGAQTVPTTIAMVPGSATKVSVIPTASLDYATRYTLAVQATVTDMYGNSVSPRDTRFNTGRIPGNLVTVPDIRFTNSANVSLIGGTLPVSGQTVKLAVDLNGSNIPAGQSRTVTVTIMIKNAANELKLYKAMDQILTSADTLATVNLGNIVLPAGSGLRAEIFIWDKTAYIPYAPVTVVAQ